MNFAFMNVINAGTQKAQWFTTSKYTNFFSNSFLYQSVGIFPLISPFVVDVFVLVSEVEKEM